MKIQHPLPSQYFINAVIVTILISILSEIRYQSLKEDYRDWCQFIENKNIDTNANPIWQEPTRGWHNLFQSNLKPSKN